MEKEKLSLPIPKGDSAYNTASRYCNTIVAALASGMESREREADLELVGTLIETNMKLSSPVRGDIIASFLVISKRNVNLWRQTCCNAHQYGI